MSFGVVFFCFSILALFGVAIAGFVYEDDQVLSFAISATGINLACMLFVFVL
jgi:hypothetical protein